MSNRYRIDPSCVEHGCCWDAAIVRDWVPGDPYSAVNPVLICECDQKAAQTICDWLNQLGDSGP